MKVFFAEILIVAFAVVATQAGVLLETASREGFDKVEAHYLKELPNIHRDGDSLKILIAGKRRQSVCVSGSRYAERFLP